MKKWILLLLLLASFNSTAGITKWVDASGQVHYSDGPAPVNAKTTIVPISSQPASIVIPPKKEPDTVALPPAQVDSPTEAHQDRTKEKVPYLKQAGQDAFKAYLQNPGPKGFLINPDGSFVECTGKDCTVVALKSCLESNKGCKLYAVDNDVVLKK